MSPRQNQNYRVGFVLEASVVAKEVFHKEERKSKAEFHSVGSGVGRNRGFPPERKNSKKAIMIKIHCISI